MNLSFTDKTVLVTGGAKGIGYATTLSFIEAGARVVVLDIDESNKSELTNAGVHFYACDVSAENAVASVFSQLQKEFQILDVLINNAGIQTYGTVAETSESVWESTFNVNVKSTYLCSKYAMPLLLRSKAPVILNVSSVQAFVCQKGVAAYAASKAAILGLTRSIAVDYAPLLRCVAVCPGSVHTPMLQADIEAYEDREKIIRETEAIHLLNRIADPKEIAAFMLFLSSDQAQFITGQAFRIDGGIGVKIEGT